MNREPLDIVPLWLFFAAVIAFTSLALEGGYRLGRWRQARNEDEKVAPIGAMVGFVLALFAFMLAFTFGMAASRFDSRRQAVLEEANAVGTAYLRTQILHEPQRSESARLLREYVNVRAHGIQEGKLEETIARSLEIQKQLWLEATKEAKDHPGPIASLYIQSLNQMIEMHAKRVQIGMRSRIPITIWLGLFALALLAMSSVGYQAGLSPTRRSPAMLGLLLAFASVFFLIADLDRPFEGYLAVSQQAMADLQNTMNSSKP
jgi:hypothetical protein